MPKKLLLAIMMCAAAGCARNVQVPDYPNTQEQIRTVLDSELSAEQKSELVRDIVRTSKEMYQAALERADSQGRNIKDISERIVQLIVAGISVWGVTK
jgi:hypothetical protein